MARGFGVDPRIAKQIKQETGREPTLEEARGIRTVRKDLREQGVTGSQAEELLLTAGTTIARGGRVEVGVGEIRFRGREGLQPTPTEIALGQSLPADLRNLTPQEVQLRQSRIETLATTRDIEIARQQSLARPEDIPDVDPTTIQIPSGTPEPIVTPIPITEEVRQKLQEEFQQSFTDEDIQEIIEGQKTFLQQRLIELQSELPPRGVAPEAVGERLKFILEEAGTLATQEFFSESQLLEAIRIKKELGIELTPRENAAFLALPFAGAFALGGVVRTGIAITGTVGRIAGTVLGIGAIPSIITGIIDPDTRTPTIVSIGGFLAGGGVAGKLLPKQGFTSTSQTKVKIKDLIDTPVGKKQVRIFAWEQPTVKGVAGEDISRATFAAQTYVKTRFGKLRELRIIGVVRGKLLKGAEENKFSAEGITYRVQSRPVSTKKLSPITKGKGAQVSSQLEGGIEQSIGVATPKDIVLSQSRTLLELPEQIVSDANVLLRGKKGKVERITYFQRFFRKTGEQTVDSTSGQLVFEKPTKLQGLETKVSEIISKETKRLGRIPFKKLPTRTETLSPIRTTGLKEGEIRTSQIVQEVQTQAQKLGQQDKVKIIQSETLKNIFLDKQRVGERQVTQQLQKELTKQKEEQIFGVKTAEAQAQAEQLLFSEAQLQKTQQLQRTQQLERLKTRQGQIQVKIPKIPLKPKFPKTPPIIKTVSFTKKKVPKLPKGVQQAWKLFIKEKGKFKQVGGLDVRGSQVRKGAKIVRETIPATFRVESTKRRIKSPPKPFEPNPVIFRNFKIVKGRQVATPNQWIEREKFRLDSPQEVRTLKLAPKTRKKKRKSSSTLGGMNFLQ